MPIIAPEAARRMSLFSGLTEQEKDELLKSGRIHHVSRGQMLFAHGDPVKYFYLITSGIMQLFRVTPDGHEKPSPS